MNTIRPSELVDVFIQRTGFVFYRTLLLHLHVCLISDQTNLMPVGKQIIDVPCGYHNICVVVSTRDKAIIIWAY